MKRLRLALAALALLTVLFACPEAKALFHGWIFSEFFTNADGSVQFIEMHSPALSGEVFATGAEIRTDSGNVFTFPGDLSGGTFNKRLLIAIAPAPGFSSLPGAVAPDFTLPTADFFDPAGDRVRLFHPSLGEFHSRTFSSVPTDGVRSLNYPPIGGTVLDNTPTNFAGQVGAINLSAPSPTGDYNGNGVVDAGDFVQWRDTLDQSVANGQGADGSGNGTIDQADYDFWRARFGNAVGPPASAAAVPEPSTILTALLVAGLLAQCGRREISPRDSR